MVDTTIKLSQETKERLNNLGRKGDSYDEIVSKLIDEHDDLEMEK